MVKQSWFLVAAFLAFTACATGGGGSEDSEPSATLEVENRSTYRMTIYVVRQSGARRRLGQAGSLATTRFTIPRTLLFGITPLRFQADPIGRDRAPISDEITVVPGDTVKLVIPPF